MEAFLVSPVLAAVVAGVFQLMGHQMEVKQKNLAPIPQSTGSNLSAQPSSASFNPGTALKQIGIIQLIGNLMGFILGLVMYNASIGAFILTLLIVGTIVLTGCFFWAGMLVNRAIRWKHLTYVAVGVAITTLVVNSLLLQMPVQAAHIIVAFLQTFTAMGIGGLFANAVKG